MLLPFTHLSHTIVYPLFCYLQAYPVGEFVVTCNYVGSPAKDSKAICHGEVSADSTGAVASKKKDETSIFSFVFKLDAEEAHKGGRDWDWNIEYRDESAMQSASYTEDKEKYERDCADYEKKSYQDKYKWNWEKKGGFKFPDTQDYITTASKGQFPKPNDILDIHVDFYKVSLVSHIHAHSPSAIDLPSCLRFLHKHSQPEKSDFAGELTIKYKVKGWNPASH